MSNLAAVLFASGPTRGGGGADAQARADRAQSAVRLLQARPGRDGEGRLQARTARCSRRKSTAPRTTTSSSSGSALADLRPGRYRRRAGRTWRIARRTARRATIATCTPPSLRTSTVIRRSFTTGCSSTDRGDRYRIPEARGEDARDRDRARARRWRATCSPTSRRAARPRCATTRRSSTTGRGEIVVTSDDIERRTRDIPASVKRDIEFATAQVRRIRRRAARVDPRVRDGIATRALRRTAARARQRRRLLRADGTLRAHRIGLHEHRDGEGRGRAHRRRVLDALPGARGFIRTCSMR